MGKRTHKQIAALSNVGLPAQPAPFERDFEAIQPEQFSSYTPGSTQSLTLPELPFIPSGEEGQRSWWNGQCGIDPPPPAGDGTGDPRYVSDLDGNQYGMVNNTLLHCWMDSNLRTTQYSDGTPIPGGANLSGNAIPWAEWMLMDEGGYAVYPSCTGPSYCAPDGCELMTETDPGDCPHHWLLECENQPTWDYECEYEDSSVGDSCSPGGESQCILANQGCAETYGNLYNWYAVDNAAGLCPEGWRVANDFDWLALEWDSGNGILLGNNDALCNDHYYVWESPATNNCTRCDYVYNCNNVIYWWGPGTDEDIPIADLGNGCCAEHDPPEESSCAPFGAFCCDDLLHLLQQHPYHCPDHSYDYECTELFSPCGDANQWSCMAENVHCPEHGYDTDCSQAGDYCGENQDQICLAIDSCEDFAVENWYCHGCHCHPEHQWGDCIGWATSGFCPACAWHEECWDENIIEGFANDFGFRGIQGLGSMFAGEEHLWKNSAAPMVAPDIILHPDFDTSGLDLVPGGIRGDWQEVMGGFKECLINGGWRGGCWMGDCYYTDFDSGHEEGDPYTGCPTTLYENPPYPPNDPAGDAFCEAENGGWGALGPWVECGDMGGYCGDNWPWTYYWVSYLSRYWTSTSVLMMGLDDPDDSHAIVRTIPNGHEVNCNGNEGGCTCVNRGTRDKRRGNSVRCVADMATINTAIWGAYCTGCPQDDGICHQNMVVDQESPVACGSTCGVNSWCGYTRELFMVEDSTYYGDPLEIELKVRKWNAYGMPGHWYDYTLLDPIGWSVEVTENDHAVSAQVQGGTLSIQQTLEHWNGTAIIKLTMGGQDTENGMWVTDYEYVDITVTPYPDNPECSGYFEIDSIDEDDWRSTGIDLKNGPGCDPGSNWDSIDFFKIINVDNLTGVLRDGAGIILENGSIVESSITPTSPTPVEMFDGWNLVSLPMGVNDATYSSVYPDAVQGTLYEFIGTYEQASVLVNGVGYWLMYDENITETVEGDIVTEVTIPLIADWNLIGGISTPINFYSISDPENILIPGTLYGFSGTYQQALVIHPGQGYWVRASAAGEVTLDSALMFPAYFRPAADQFGNTTFTYQACAGDPGGDWACSDDIYVNIPITPVMDDPTIYDINVDSDLENTYYPDPATFEIFRLSENAEGIIRFRAITDPGFPNSDIHLTWTVTDLSENFVFETSPFTWGNEVPIGNDVELKLVPKKNYNTFNFDNPSVPVDEPISVIVTATLPATNEYDSVWTAIAFEVSVPYVSSKPEASYLEIFVGMDPPGISYWEEAIIFHPTGIDDQTYNDWLANPGSGCGDETWPPDWNNDWEKFDLCIYDPDPYENNPWWDEEYPTLADAYYTYLAIQITGWDTSGSSDTVLGHDQNCDNDIPLWYRNANGDTVEVSPNFVYPSDSDELFHIPYFSDGVNDLKLYYICENAWWNTSYHVFTVTISYRIVECIYWSGTGGGGSGWGQPYCAKSTDFDWNCNEDDETTLDCSEENYITIFVYEQLGGFTNFYWETLGVRNGVDFTDTSVPGTNATMEIWFWEFGDGGTSEDQNPSHNYTNAGLYEVTLTTEDSQGHVNSLTQLVEVS
ncbi:MAG: hypothetical protein CMB80_05305 [Flammeovirgaceae bacterium]|nr:hypothetical protein [Flammeovirgaceae bacterium]